MKNMRKVVHNSEKIATYIRACCLKGDKNQWKKVRSCNTRLTGYYISMALVK